MKKVLILFCTVLVANALFATSFNSDPPYNQLLAKVYKAEFISETTSELLKVNLADVYSNFFDVVERADLHRDLEGTYYYAAYGLKDGKPLVELITVSDEYAFDQFYPSKADMGFAPDDFVIPCYCDGPNCTKDGEGRKCGIAGFDLPCKPAKCPVVVDPIDTDPINTGN